MTPFPGLCRVGAAGVGGFRVNVALRVTPPAEPETTTGVCTETALVVTVKVRLVVPAATVTLAGTLAAVELSERATTVPPGGAAALNLTVPVAELPPTTVLGLSEIVLRADELARVTLSAANWVALPSVADSWTVVLSTGKVVTSKLAEVAPAGTVTVPGTLAAPGRLLPRLTVAPPAGAALPSVTVPVEGVPPVTLLGLTLRPVSAGRLGETVRVAERVTPRPVTEMVTSVGAVTDPVVMLNLPRVVEALTWRTPGRTRRRGCCWSPAHAGRIRPSPTAG